MVTVLIDGKEARPFPGRAEGERLWLSVTDLEAATGWSSRPQGLCRDAVCVPLPPDRERDLVREGQVDVAALWRHLGKPVIHSAGGDVWVFGEAAAERAAALRSLQAPDVVLPDAAGRQHALSDHRGRKVLLVSWASW